MNAHLEKCIAAVSLSESLSSRLRNGAELLLTQSVSIRFQSVFGTERCPPTDKFFCPHCQLLGVLTSQIFLVIISTSVRSRHSLRMFTDIPEMMKKFWCRSCSCRVAVSDDFVSCLDYPPKFFTCDLFSSSPRDRLEDCSVFQMMYDFPSDSSSTSLSSPDEMIVTFLSSVSSPC